MCVYLDKNQYNSSEIMKLIVASNINLQILTIWKQMYIY